MKKVTMIMVLTMMMSAGVKTYKEEVKLTNTETGHVIIVHVDHDVMEDLDWVKENL